LLLACAKSRIQYRSLGLLAGRSTRLYLLRVPAPSRLSAKIFPLTQWSRTLSNVQRRLTKADPHTIVSAIDL
jgi:hypothetical protein